MGIFGAKSAVQNVSTQKANAARRAKAVSSAKAGKAAGRGRRSIGGNAATPRTTRGW